MILLGKHEPHKVLGKPRASGDDPMIAGDEKLVDR